MPADQEEFRMNNSPNPLIAPIKRVESLTNWGSDSKKATVLLRPRKPFNSKEIFGLFSKTPFVSGKKQVFWVNNQIWLLLPVALVKTDPFL